MADLAMIVLGVIAFGFGTSRRLKPWKVALSFGLMIVILVIFDKTYR